MPNLSIDTLPLLSSSNFSPYSDYIVVQKPDGQTYKMLLSDAYGASNSVGSNYQFTETHFLNLNSLDTKEISFKENGLLDESTSFIATITTTLVNNHQNNGIYPHIGTVSVFKFTKPTDSKFINKNISLESSAQQNIAAFTRYFEQRGIPYYPTTTYRATIDTTAEDAIKFIFSSSVYGFFGPWENDRTMYPAYEVQISTTLQANIM